MATEATFTVPSTAFPLGSIFEQLPGVTVELERIIPSRDVVVPYFWVRGRPVDDVEAAFAEHPGVNDIKLVDSIDDQYLLRVEWAMDYDGVLATLTEIGLALIEAVGTNEQWTFDVRGDERDDVADFQRRCRDLDIPITLTRIHALTPLDPDVGAGLTDPQREALTLAYERGYFNTPRDCTMAEIGEELGITQQAVASRLRRGIEQILGETFV